MTSKAGEAPVDHATFVALASPLYQYLLTHGSERDRYAPVFRALDAFPDLAQGAREP